MRQKKLFIAVIAITSDNSDLQGELNLVRERILPVL
jgi:hypothetical protein